MKKPVTRRSDERATRSMRPASSGGSRPTRAVRPGANAGADPEAEEPRTKSFKPPADDGNKKMMIYGGVGAGALLLILILFMSGGSSRRGGGGDVDRDLTRVINEAAGLQANRNPQAALDVCDRALGESRFRNRARYNDLKNLAENLRRILNADRDAITKTADLRRRVDAAVADGSAMKNAKAFWDECQRLIGEYRMSSAGPDLSALRSDLQRWVQTESQSDWQRDYNSVKDRVVKQFMANGLYAEAAREWKRFGEASQDPVLKNRIEKELADIDTEASDKARKLVDSAGTGAEARKTLEEAMSRFGGTQGQEIIKKALRTLP